MRIRRGKKTELAAAACGEALPTRAVREGRVACERHSIWRGNGLKASIDHRPQPTVATVKAAKPTRPLTLVCRER